MDIIVKAVLALPVLLIIKPAIKTQATLPVKTAM